MRTYGVPPFESIDRIPRNRTDSEESQLNSTPDIDRKQDAGVDDSTVVAVAASFATSDAATMPQTTSSAPELAPGDFKNSASGARQFYRSVMSGFPPAEKPALQYKDDCPSLSKHRPYGFPHIIDLENFHTEETDLRDLHAADGIATFLWTWDKEQFRRFFDLSKSKFKILYEAPDHYFDGMVISRNDRTVVASWGLEEDKSQQELTFIIEDDGSWTGKTFWSAENGSQMFVNPKLINGSGRMFSEVLLSGGPFMLEEEGMRVTVLR